MKRANGTGNVVKLSGPRRRPWAVRVSVRDSAGHIVQRVLGCYERSAEAQAALEAYNRSVAEGGPRSGISPLPPSARCSRPGAPGNTGS